MIRKLLDRLFPARRLPPTPRGRRAQADVAAVTRLHSRGGRS